MKSQKTLIGIAIMALTASCTADDASTTSPATAAHFVATIDGSTRAHDTAWGEGDKVGVTGTSGAKAYSNVAYSTAKGDGSFAAIDDSAAIYFQDDSEVAFTAYYPWSASTTITADTREQQAQSQYDFLYATARGSKASPTVSLTFAHQMAKMVLTLVTGDDVTYDELKSMKLSLGGIKLSGSFDGLTGEATATGEPSAEWLFAGNDNAPMTLDDANQTVTYQLILFPQQLSAPITLAATLAQVFAASIDLSAANATAGDSPATNAIVGGRQYNLRVTLSKTELNIASCTITPWTVLEVGTVTVE